MPGRKYTNGSAYRYGFNGQEKSLEIAEGVTTAEFWEYDSRIGRRWNIDPVTKQHESPYSAFANNPLWFRDTKGADTITFNNSGKETSRFYTKNSTRHVYLREGGNSKDASYSFHGKNYYRGFSYFSLFGDPDGNEKPTPFKSISKEITDLPTFLDEEQEVKESFANSSLPEYSKRAAFWFNSGYKEFYDYKYSGILGKSDESTVYEIEGIIYNKRELGTMKWGYVASGVYKNYDQLMLHNNLMHKSVEGNGDEWNEMYTCTFGYTYGKNKQSALATHTATDVLLKSHYPLYWYLKSPYRSEPGFTETKDKDNWKTAIKRANILLMK